MTFAPIKPQCRYLLGNKSHHEYDNTGDYHECRKVREAGSGHVGIPVIDEAAQKEETAYRKEYLERGKEGCNLKYDI